MVDFDTDELVEKSIAALNRDLIVTKVYFKVESGSMDELAFIKHCRERIKVLLMLGFMAEAAEAQEMIEVLS